MNTLFDAAAQARAEGIARAANHAERKSPGWSDRAMAFLAEFASTTPEFISEQVVAAATAAGLTAPDARAWGGVFMAAKRRGLIVKTGRFREAVTSNLSPKPVWRRA